MHNNQVKTPNREEKNKKKRQGSCCKTTKSTVISSFQWILKTWCSKPFYFAFQCAVHLRMHNACQEWESCFSKTKLVQKLCFVACSTLWVQFCFVKLQMSLANLLYAAIRDNLSKKRLFPLSLNASRITMYQTASFSCTVISH